MVSSHFIVATAGHVDHGKSALVKALTGTDPDRLPEEKARGITIDLGFAHLELPRPGSGPGGPTADSTLSIGLVDVPGHEDFVKNMVAGVGSIDAALLIVAADDGWMPQTEEHLQILTYLGVRHAVVALTKIDLAAGREAAAVESVRAELRDSLFADAPIVPTSCLTGHGLEELKGALAAVLAALPPPRDIGKPRLPIDRVFILRGIGTIATGTLSGGVFHRNQTVVIQPGAGTARIRTLQNHHQEVASALPGTRAALNLPDLAASTGGGAGISRGQVVTVPSLGGATRTLDVLLEKSRRLGAEDSAGRPLKNGALVRLHHGSANTAARIALLGDGPLGPGGQTLAQLRLEEPIFALAGDRFIVRDPTQRSTLAGGLILDVDPQRRLLRSEARLFFLQPRARTPDDPIVWAGTQLLRDHAVSRTGFLQRTRFSESEINGALSQMAAAGSLTIVGDHLLDTVWFGALRDKAAQAIQAEHVRHPEKNGLLLSELRSLLEPYLPDGFLFELVLAELGKVGFVQAGTAIRHSGHRPALPPALQAAGTRLRAALAAKPLEPPGKKELLADPQAHQALRFLLDTGEAVEVGPDVVLLTEHFHRARELVCDCLRQRGPATASELRQFIGTNRRVVIPLLERLDRDGITVRQGDQRVLRSK
jgi:selenocysteine-specific elongation factor